MRKSPEVNVGPVYRHTKSRLRKVSSGKITIDSGAGKSVCPASMVPEERACQTIQAGTRYKAVGGQALISGGKRMSDSKLAKLSVP